MTTPPTGPTGPTGPPQPTRPTDAPIVAVTVYPDRARVTRRCTVRLPAGEHRVPVGPLPQGLHRDSVRVGGRGPATVLGVDVVTRRLPRTGDRSAAALEEQRRAVAAELVELADADAVEAQRAEFLAQLTQRAGGTYARALAAGDADPARVGAFADSVAEQLAAVKARQRELARRRDEARDRLAALDRQLADVTRKRQPDRLVAEVGLAVRGDAEVELELSYVVDGAGWQSSYDVRLDAGPGGADRLTLTWFGLVTQRTGEDWPECDLVLSTARPAGAVTVPELDPWYLDRARPIPVARPIMARAAGPAPGGMAKLALGAAEMADEPLVEVSATVEQGVAAATYRPARPVAVPADNSAHRATVAVLELGARLGHVTAPVRSPEAYLRATAVNGSEHTLLPGPAAVFHGGDFVGTTRLQTWAPGEEVELALGVDDRVRVERKLVRRVATKATLGSTRRREVEYRITVANHTPRETVVTVLDQLPVSRDEGVTVRELRLEPPPAERAELGELVWRLRIPAGQSREILLGLRVELAKGVEVVGWRE